LKCVITLNSSKKIAMPFLKPLFRLAFFIIPSLFYAQHTDQINSNRPGETMSSFAVGKSVFQLEMGIYGIKEHHSKLNYDANGFGLDATLRWGIFKEQLEVIVDFQYQFEKYNALFVSNDKSALKQTILGAKYLIYDPALKFKKKEADLYSWKGNNKFNWDQLIPSVAVFAGANLTFSNNPYYFSPQGGISPKIMLITQNRLGDGKWVFVTNIIADYLGTDYPSYGYVLTMTRGFNDKWSGFLENQGYSSKFYSDGIMRGGAAFLVTKDLQIDASISASLKTTPSIVYGGVGFSWRFDDNYTEVKIPIDKNKDSKKGKKKSKGKKNKIDVEVIPITPITTP
jgi:Putative MetA-pathway of phenol degradation